MGIFNGANKCTPDRIIFLRDGVSEGEFSRVRDTEVEAIHGKWFSHRPTGGLTRGGRKTRSPRSDKSYPEKG